VPYVAAGYENAHGHGAIDVVVLFSSPLAYNDACPPAVRRRTPSRQHSCELRAAEVLPTTRLPGDLQILSLRSSRCKPSQRQLARASGCAFNEDESEGEAARRPLVVRHDSRHRFVRRPKSGTGPAYRDYLDASRRAISSTLTIRKI
jgi:hypothetical protein